MGGFYGSGGGALITLVNCVLRRHPERYDYCYYMAHHARVKYQMDPNEVGNIGRNNRSIKIPHCMHTTRYLNRIFPSSPRLVFPHLAHRCLVSGSFYLSVLLSHYDANIFVLFIRTCWRRVWCCSQVPSTRGGSYAHPSSCSSTRLTSSR